MAETSSTAKIICQSISKTFIQKGTQRVHVLEDINLEVRDNEFLVILGALLDKGFADMLADDFGFAALFGHR